MNSLKKF